MLEFEIIHGEEEVPTIYELGVADSGLGLVLSVEKSAFGEVSNLLSNPELRIFRLLNKDLDLPQFIPPTDQWLGWGFGPVLSAKNDSRANFVSWECALPKIAKYPVGYEQFMAGASAEQLQDPRFFSDHTREIHWNAGHQVAATLCVLFKTLNYLIDTPSQATTPQLLTVETGVRLGSHPIDVSLGRSMLHWLAQVPGEFYHFGMADVMKKAYSYMMGEDREFRGSDRCEARFRDGWRLDLTCPGDRCSLSPEDNSKPKNQGYKLYPHNVDTSAQQLTLLMGIAAMHDQIRREL